ncbi:MAG: HlyC/CorC family transporter [Simkaniaceae bacterium]|nr:HlyC/CorC family transporter [Simkaniaceae bacterium]
MNQSWQVILLYIIIFLIIQGFFSMMEMSAVSFNKVRLQYFVGKNNRRAIWLSKLLKNPARLFGTTLIGVNAALQFGSELSRMFYLSIGLSPDLAPISQVFIVLIFAELVPMFAGRRYAENVAMLGIPLLYFASIVMAPLVWCLDIICRIFNKIFGIVSVSGLNLSREELQKAIEAREDRGYFFDSQEVDAISANIFSLKNKTPKQLMDPLEQFTMIPTTATIASLKKTMGIEPVAFLPVYHQNQKNIVAVAFPRDFLRLNPEDEVRAHCRSPWFITESTPILQILKEFRRNNQNLAVVLSEEGSAVGILTLDAVIDEIFGERDEWLSIGEYHPEKRHVYIDRSFHGDTKIEEINRTLKIELKAKPNLSLEEFLSKHLGRRPDIGETIRLQDFEFTLEESTLLGGMKIFIRTI